jgi:hypothetical protein
MPFFKSKYRRRIEDKILELYHERLNCVNEAGLKRSELTPKEQIHYIMLKGEYDKQIDLLKSLL